MRYKKVLLILCAVFFFLAALTAYLNRVVFPKLIKKIAVERLEEALKRKVEIGSIHFNWFKGFIIDKIKVYEKDPPDTVFAQADQVSFGVIVFPGFKHYRITIPFINVRSPSIHLIHTGQNTWNFTDIYTLPASSATPAAPAAPPAPAKKEKASPFEMAWGGITITDGKILVDDNSPHPSSEFFDNINLKLSLSYKGISYDFTADIPRKKGFVGATVYYQPMTQNTQAQIHLKNIDTASYLSLVDIPQVHLNSGIIKETSLTINYTPAKTSAQGDMTMDNWDITNQDQGFKGASIQTKVNDFELTKEAVRFAGWVRAQGVIVHLKDRQLQVNNAVLDSIKIKKDSEGIQVAGNITTRGMAAQWSNQKLEGNISLKNLNLRMKDEKTFGLEGELQANDVTLALGANRLASAAVVKANKLSFNVNDGTISVSATLNSSAGKFILDRYKTIEADPQLEINLQMPLNDTRQLAYKGSITLSGGRIMGFTPVQLLENVELDVDFQNDSATINALGADILNTNVRASGTVKNFKDPDVHITLEADELDLAKIKDFAPQIVDPYGLSFDGTSWVKVQYEGPASRPAKAKILGVASFKGISVASSKLHQRLKNISGIVEATPDSLKWRDITATYLGQPYTLTGSLEHFKNPEITTTLHGPDLQVKADIVKHNDVITINTITGKYLNTAFDSKGSIGLTQGQQPVFDINGNATLLLEDLVKILPADQKKGIQPLNPSGIISMTAGLKGTGLDWKNYTLNASLTSPTVKVMGYSLTDMKISASQEEGKIKNLTFDGKLYDGTVHAVGSLDLTAGSMPYDLALNIDSTDLHKLKMDSPLKMEEINGKFFLTTIAHGTVTDFKNSLAASGSLAIRDGFLADFNLFKGLYSVLNDALRIGQVMITDVEGNFTVDNQKINTDNLSLKGPTIVLLGKGWVNFDGLCDLDLTVDLSSGVVPAIAHDVLSTLNIHIYDKISNPKFKKKISVPQVINTLLKNLLQ